MPKVTRSDEEVEAVRDNILDVAFKILVKNGYEGLSMSKIGAKMKMTAANIYNYYANKDELLITIHKKAYLMLYEKLNRAVEMSDTPLARYQNLVFAFVEFGLRNINIYDIIFNRPIRQHSDYVGTSQEALSDDEFRSSLRVLFLAVKIIQEYRETRPDLPSVAPEVLTLQNFSALHGIISLHNSGTFSQVTDDQDAMLKIIIENAMRCVTG
jgi:AcrR family transcriptional regulator